ncbi:Acetate kinase [compost metagenome]
MFTAGVGENSVVLRKAVCEGISFLGVELDEARNAERRKDTRTISTDNSRVKVLVVPTNEELLIARDTYQIVQQTVNK